MILLPIDNDDLPRLETPWPAFPPQRFKIEIGFKLATEVAATYQYRFWMTAMKRIRHRGGN
ncbi:MAG: hypothetical protein AB8B64_14815 [Granulosicoccus sp.]